ncbi:hypothetical protein [Faecalicatena contorta]|uniref:hypothetical protein n=1 Tax=Faecalicatena contorta TaxID=39482 RepID=UPI001F3F12FC|nr:hypothetical protein [Faecalicatena contorta]MCF2667504.1 hypothetical protein [Faecalicatena contorta]
MLEYMDKKQYKKAMEIADTIDWRRVKNVSMLNMVSEIYEYNGEFQKSRDILFVAFDRAPGSRKIVYRLGNLALKIEDFEEASDCYEEFVKLAPKDPNQYILKYKILRAQGAPLEEQIHAMEDFKKAEYVEKWAYELAKLYHEAGMTAECLEECDDLILWFSEGKYVYQAMELKMKYKPLTPLQKEKYDARPGAPKKEESEKTEEKKPEQAKTPMAEIIREAEAAEEEKVQDVARELKQNGIDVAEELPEVMEEEIPEEKPEKHSAITRVVKGATLQEALATGVAIASGINIEEKAMKEKEEALRVTGQMRIEEILQEWEAKQKANAEVIEKKKQEDRERIRKEREAAERRKEAERLEVERKAAEAARKAAEEEAARKAAEEEAARKAAEEEAARKAAEEAARKAAEEEAARKAAEEAARKAAEEEARKAAEEEAARKAAEEEAARKAAEEEAARKAAEEAARKAAEEEAAKKAAEEEAAKKAAEEADTIIQGKTQRIPDDIVKLMEEMENDVEEDNFEADALEDTFETEEVEDQEEDFDIEDFIGDFEEDFAEEFEEDFDEEDFGEEDFEEEDFDEEDFGEDFGEEDFAEEDFEEEDFGEEDFEEEDFGEEDFEEEDFGEEDFEEDDFEEEELEEEELEEEDFEEEDFEEEELEKAEPEPVTETLEIEEPSEEEIQKRIKKSKGGGVPFDTGFVVTGRYDLSATSEIGLKAGLTEEQKKLFSYFVPVRGMSEQIVEVLDNDRRAQREGTSKTGNLLVIGRKGSGKTVLAVDIVKAIQKQRNLKQGKVAIVTGESLNKKELTNIIQKLRGGAIIIEKAGKLNSRTIKELNYLMEKKTGELLFVLEDQRKPLERLMTANPDFKKKFTSRLELPVFINDELVTFGQTYAKENGYKLDEMGILALYSRIDVMQREDHAVSVAEVKEIMDEAIEHSQKANVKHLARRVFGRSTDESDRIILKEEDFKI